MIIIEDIHFSYTPSEPIFRSLELTIESGASVCFVGQDGAGKSTLFKIIKGIILPLGGGVRFDFVTSTTPRNVGYLGGDPYDSFVGITVEDEIVFGPENMGLPVDEIQSRLDLALELTELKGYEKRLTHTLSGGEQQKLALAALLVMDLKILIIDDAFSMMDPPSRSRHWRWINKLKHELGLTILFTTNRLEELNNADRVLFLEKRSHKFIFDGMPDDFMACSLCDDWLELENGVDKLKLLLSRQIVHASSGDMDLFQSRAIEKLYHILRL